MPHKKRREHNNTSTEIKRVSGVKIKQVGKTTTCKAGTSIKKANGNQKVNNLDFKRNGERTVNKGESKGNLGQPVIRKAGAFVPFPDIEQKKNVHQPERLPAQTQMQERPTDSQNGRAEEYNRYRPHVEKTDSHIWSQKAESGTKIKKFGFNIQSQKTVIHKKEPHINRVNTQQEDQKQEEEQEKPTAGYLYIHHQKPAKIGSDSQKQSSGLNGQDDVRKPREEAKGKEPEGKETHAGTGHQNQQSHIFSQERMQGNGNEEQNGKAQQKEQVKKEESKKGENKKQERKKGEEEKEQAQKGNKKAVENNSDEAKSFLKSRVINTVKSQATYQAKQAGSALVRSQQQEEYRKKRWMEEQIQRYGAVAMQKEVRIVGQSASHIAVFVGRQLKVMFSALAGALMPILVPVLAVILAVILITNIFSLLFREHEQQMLPQAVNVSAEVLAYRQEVAEAAARYNMSQYVELILAVMMQESSGQGLDPMQSSEGAYNTRYPKVPNGITDPAYSIECGIQELKYALDAAGCTGPTDMEHIKLALQGYNYGSGYISWAISRDGGYTPENAILFSNIWADRMGWSGYGDKNYVPHVLRYYMASIGNRNAIIMEGMKYMGMPYVYGGSSPETSFDCSGFIYYVYNQCGYSVPRMTAQGFYDMCVPVSEAEAKPGDLCFFERTYDFYERITHIGIYIGNGQMMHFGNPGKISPISSFGNKFVGYGRLAITVG